MGHDFACNGDGEDIYVSYNHCWAFYEFLDNDRGFRAIYDYRADKLLPKLLVVQEALREIAPETFHLNWKNAPHLIKDGWACVHTIDAVGNAYKCVQKIIDKCVKFPQSRFSGD